MPSSLRASGVTVDAMRGRSGGRAPAALCLVGRSAGGGTKAVGASGRWEGVTRGASGPRCVVARWNTEGSADTTHWGVDRHPILHPTPCDHLYDV